VKLKLPAKRNQPLTILNGGETTKLIHVYLEPRETNGKYYYGNTVNSFTSLISIQISHNSVIVYWSNDNIFIFNQ
jgi:hypothetical protein